MLYVVTYIPLHTYPPGSEHLPHPLLDCPKPLGMPVAQSSDGDAGCNSSWYTSSCEHVSVRCVSVRVCGQDNSYNCYSYVHMIHATYVHDGYMTLTQLPIYTLNYYVL